MTQVQVQNIINECKVDGDDNKSEKDNQIEVAHFLKFAEPLLKNDSRGQYLQIAEAYLNGVIGLSHYSRKSLEKDNRLWITKPRKKLFVEKNQSFNVIDNLTKLIKLGGNIPSEDNLKLTIEGICYLLRKQPLMTELMHTKADYLECIICLGIINLHFEGRELFTILNVVEKFNLPTSYAARFTNRINSGYSVLVNEEFIACVTNETMHHSFCLGKKTIQLLTNPSEFYSK